MLLMVWLHLAHLVGQTERFHHHLPIVALTVDSNTDKASGIWFSGGWNKNTSLLLWFLSCLENLWVMLAKTRSLCSYWLQSDEKSCDFIRKHDITWHDWSCLEDANPIRHQGLPTSCSHITCDVFTLFISDSSTSVRQAIRGCVLQQKQTNLKTECWTCVQDGEQALLSEA